MQFGYCNISVIPLRKESDDRSEIISQLLFGETCKILNIKDNWFYIQCTHDAYEGWVDGKQITTTEKLLSVNFSSLELAHNMVFQQHHIPILIGSNLPDFDGLNFTINKQKYLFQGLTLENSIHNFDKVKKIALKYLHAPYLWGGRSPFGIDCSGFTQIVFKFFNEFLPRDAYQQAEKGIAIGFVEESREGDLAFFGNEEKITHVGIIINTNEVIHASGKVRIDKLDHLGIFNRETGEYTHKLRVIKRII